MLSYYTRLALGSFRRNPGITALMVLAGVNILLFYGTSAFAEVKTIPAGASAPLRIKLMAAASLGAWIGVLVCGRLITFFRPPFFH